MAVLFASSSSSAARVRAESGAGEPSPGAGAPLPSGGATGAAAAAAAAGVTGSVHVSMAAYHCHCEEYISTQSSIPHMISTRLWHSWSQQENHAPCRLQACIVPRDLLLGCCCVCMQLHAPAGCARCHLLALPLLVPPLPGAPGQPPQGCLTASATSISVSLPQWPAAEAGRRPSREAAVLPPSRAWTPRWTAAAAPGWSLHDGSSGSEPQQASQT